MNGRERPSEYDFSGERKSIRDRMKGAFDREPNQGGMAKALDREMDRLDVLWVSRDEALKTFRTVRMIVDTGDHGNAGELEIALAQHLQNGARDKLSGLTRESPEPEAVKAATLDYLDGRISILEERP